MVLSACLFVVSSLKDVCQGLVIDQLERLFIKLTLFEDKTHINLSEDQM